MSKLRPDADGDIIEVAWGGCRDSQTVGRGVCLGSNEVSTLHRLNRSEGKLRNLAAKRNLGYKRCRLEQVKSFHAGSRRMPLIKQSFGYTYLQRLLRDQYASKYSTISLLGK